MLDKRLELQFRLNEQLSAANEIKRVEAALADLAA
jgi:hypothetical protein